MRTLMWLGLVAATAISLLIACVPGPAPALLSNPLIHSPFSDQIPDGTAILHVCDKQGICCYWTRNNSGISCVATKVIVQIFQEDPRSERENKGSSESGGKVQNGGLEARLLRDNKF